MKKIVGLLLYYICVAGAPMFAMGWYVGGWAAALAMSLVIPFCLVLESLSWWLINGDR